MHHQDQEQTIVSPTKDSWIGRTVAGKYEVLHLLGKGGMSSVYKVKHVLLGKVYALKVMHNHLVTDASAVTRFKQEAAAASALSHRNIIAVHDYEVVDGQPFQAIDYLEGTSLAEEIRRNGPLEPHRAIDIFIQTCSALAHAHEKGVIHRDLKPSNVMLIDTPEEKDVVKILDFGIAKLLPQEGEAVQRLTQTGEIFGSPLYMSPEQCLGQPLDARSDIYSLGCLMYETLTGKPPLYGTSVFATIQKHVDETPKSLKEELKPSRLIEELDAIVGKTLAKQPGQRHQTMRELMADLERVKKGESGNPLMILQRWLNLLAIRTEPVRKKLPARLVIPLAVVSVFLCVAVAIIAQVWTASIPSFKSVDWPQFETEAAVTGTIGKDDALVSVANITKRQLLRRTTESSNASDPVMRAQYAMAPVALFAGNGQYEEAARQVQNLELVKKLQALEQINPDIVSVLQSDRTDRLRALQELCAIGDACYVQKNFKDAQFFYNHAAYQLDGAAEHLNKRIQLKLGDCALQMNQPEEANGHFKRAATLGSTERYGDDLLIVRDDFFSADRAAWLSKLGDILAPSDLQSAIKAYTSAAKEWQKNKDGALAAQALFRLSKCFSRANQIGEAEQALKEAIQISQDMPQDPTRENLPALYKELADMYLREGKYLEAIDAETKAVSTNRVASRER